MSETTSKWLSSRLKEQGLYKPVISYPCVSSSSKIIKKPYSIPNILIAGGRLNGKGLKRLYTNYKQLLIEKKIQISIHFQQYTRELALMNLLT